MKSYLPSMVVYGLLAGACGLTTPAWATAEDAGWGNVKGQVVFGGPMLPPRKQKDVTQDRMHCLEKGPILSDELIINKDSKGIRWTFVWLAPVKGGRPLKETIHPSLRKIKDREVVIDQPCCMFEPHAVALRQGQVLVAKNSSPVAHSFRWASINNPGGNVSIPAKQSHKIADLVADRSAITLACGMHPWMGGWVRVFDHPYYAVTDQDGKFEIKSAPAGNYRLIIWHELGWVAGGKEGQPIAITINGTTDVGKIEFSPM